MSIAESAYNLLKINGGEISPAAALTPYTPKRRKTTAAGKIPKKKHARRKATPAQIAAPIPPESTPAPERITRIHATRELNTLDSVYTPKGTNSNLERVYIESTPIESINNSIARKDTQDSIPTPPKARKPRAKDGTLTLEVFTEILRRMSEEGTFIADSAKTFGLSTEAVYRAIDRRPEWSTLYVRARLKQADALFRRTIETAEQCDGSQESFNRSRLLIDTLKWACAKIHPAKYSDKAQLAVTGADGGPVTIAAAVVNAAEVKAVRDMLRDAITTTADEIPPPAALLDNTPSEVK